MSYRHCLNAGFIAILLIGLAACGSDEPERQANSPNQEKIDLFSGVPCEQYQEGAVAETKNASGLSADLDATYRSSCKICHENPGSGAPATGDTEAWAERIAQGKALLIEHSINGYKAMPPLGLCMACTEIEIVQLIEYMSGSVLEPQTDDTKVEAAQ